MRDRKPKKIKNQINTTRHEILGYKAIYRFMWRPGIYGSLGLDTCHNMKYNRKLFWHRNWFDSTTNLLFTFCVLQSFWFCHCLQLDNDDTVSISIIFAKSFRIRWQIPSNECVALCILSNQRNDRKRSFCGMLVAMWEISCSKLEIEASPSLNNAQLILFFLLVLRSNIAVRSSYEKIQYFRGEENNFYLIWFSVNPSIVDMIILSKKNTFH